MPQNFTKGYHVHHALHPCFRLRFNVSRAKVVPSSVLRYSPDTLVPTEGQARFACGNLEDLKVASWYLMVIASWSSWSFAGPTTGYHIRTSGDLPQSSMGYCLPESQGWSMLKHVEAHRPLASRHVKTLTAFMLHGMRWRQLRWCRCFGGLSPTWLQYWKVIGHLGCTGISAAKVWVTNWTAIRFLRHFAPYCTLLATGSIPFQLYVGTCWNHAGTIRRQQCARRSRTHLDGQGTPWDAAEPRWDAAEPPGPTLSGPDSISLDRWIAWVTRHGWINAASWSGVNTILGILRCKSHSIFEVRVA